LRRSVQRAARQAALRGARRVDEVLGRLLRHRDENAALDGGVAAARVDDGPLGRKASEALDAAEAAARAGLQHHAPHGVSLTGRLLKYGDGRIVPPVDERRKRLFELRFSVFSGVYMIPEIRSARRRSVNFEIGLVFCEAGRNFIVVPRFRGGACGAGTERD
jgi:hypothetical protein